MTPDCPGALARPQTGRLLLRWAGARSPGGWTTQVRALHAQGQGTRLHPITKAQAGPAPNGSVCYKIALLSSPRHRPVRGAGAQWLRPPRSPVCAPPPGPGATSLLLRREPQPAVDKSRSQGPGPPPLPYSKHSLFLSRECPLSHLRRTRGGKRRAAAGAWPSPSASASPAAGRPPAASRTGKAAPLDLRVVGIGHTCSPRHPRKDVASALTQAGDCVHAPPPAD